MNPAGQNIAQTSANAYNQATGTAAAGTQYRPATDVQPYMNPYRQQVIDRSLGTLDRANEMALNRVGGNATMQGAFGGARHGIAEAETNRNFADRAADMTAGLNAQGFDQAQQASLGDANFRMQSTGLLGDLSQQGFGMGRAINQDMMQQGGMQQQLQQQLIDRARQQYQGFTGAPQTALQAYAGALGAQPNQSTTTTEESPGIFDVLTAGAQFAAPFLCWVAREVYGPESLAWTEFREWLLTKSPAWLRNAYIKHGPTWAAWVKRNPWSKRILRPLMDRARASIGYNG